MIKVIPIGFFMGKLPSNASTMCINEEESKSYEVFDAFDEIVEMVQATNDCCAGDPKKLDPLFEDVKNSLYHTSKKFTKLSKLVKLINIRARHGFSDNCFSDTLCI